MNRKTVYAPLLLSALLVGCASKTRQVKSPNPNRQMAAKETATSDSTAENPILFEEEFEAQERGEVTYDIPVDRNAKVEQWLAYFQGRGRKWFHIWLERSGRYVPVMRKILKDHDLPEDLVYLSMIESGFSSSAYSRARAVGMWQFMKGTGRLYGLKIDFWVDERRDPEKSTIAAARHLKDLYDQFQSWKLAAAAYNAGSGKVSRAIKKYKTEDFWELTKGRYLRPETRAYVPKMIAAALIAKEPEKYGFVGIQPQDPLSYDKVVVKEPVNLLVLAEKSEVGIDDLMAINPELNHPVIPPYSESYELRVPSGESEKFLEALNQISQNDKFKMAAHRVRKGESLQRVSTIYGVKSQDLLKYNGLKSIRQGQMLFVPVPLDDRLAALGQKLSRTEERSSRKRRASRREAVDSVYSSNRGKAKTSENDSSDSDSKKKVHIVRRGESLRTIAKHYGLTVKQIKQTNGLTNSVIWPGKRLIVSS